MRLIQLDILRCLAIALVLGRHMTPLAGSGLLAQGSRLWQRGGWVGVDLFFVLSGFLVSGLLFYEYQTRGRVDVGRFLIRRAFKIYPPFWTMIAVTICLAPHVRRAKLASELLFVQNYGFGGLWNHTWSLAVEEHFYLLLACLVMVLIRRRPGDPFVDLPRICIAVAILCLSLRAIIAIIVPTFAPFVQVYPTHLRIDSLMFGVLLSYAWHVKGLSRDPRLTRFAPALCLVGAALLSLAFLYPLERTTWIRVVGFTLFYVGSGALLLGALSLTVPRTRLTRSAAAIGTYSYSIYLWHMPVLRWIVRQPTSQLPLDWMIYAALYLGAAVLIGIVAATVVEYPVLRVRDRWYPSTPKRVAVPLPQFEPAL